MAVDDASDVLVAAHGSSHLVPRARQLRPLALLLRVLLDEHGIKPGWLFLTGARDDVEMLRRKLGFKDPNPVFDRDISQHIGLVRFGNDALDRWMACPALANPEQIVKSILWMQTPNKRQGG